jgi:alpha-beta hydrolase superfamily lysophospholipase
VASKNTIPTLFLAGSKDNIAIQTTKAAYAAARGPKEFSVIDGAGYLLREPGSFEELAKRSAAWFEKYN